MKALLLVMAINPDATYTNITTEKLPSMRVCQEVKQELVDMEGALLDRYGLTFALSGYDEGDFGRTFTAKCRSID